MNQNSGQIDQNSGQTEQNSGQNFQKTQIFGKPTHVPNSEKWTKNKPDVTPKEPLVINDDFKTTSIFRQACTT